MHHAARWMLCLFVAIVCSLAMLLSPTTAHAKNWSGVQWVTVTSSNCNSIDSVTVNGKTAYVRYEYGANAEAYPSAHNTGSYCCADFVHRFYSTVFGVTVSNLKSTTSTPNASWGYFYQTSSPVVGDIVRFNDRVHWAIVKSVSGSTITICEQNATAGAAPLRAAVGRQSPRNFGGSEATYFHWSGYSTHTHSYTSSITRQPTCTSAGVRTYTCTAGDSSYTESIPALGHSYTSKVVAPTLTSDGYTLHTCSRCGTSYKDSYVSKPALKDDGWYYCDSIPSGMSLDGLTVEYQGVWTRVQTSSPGSDYTNAGVARTEWQNSGAQYKSNTPLQESESRVLVSSIYYHFCGPNTGNVCNHTQTSQYVHYDWVPASSVNASFWGDDEGHPYYHLYWKSDGSEVYCQSGKTCDGAYGSHGKRCRSWYLENCYQDRVKVTYYTYQKTSDWSSQKVNGADSCKIRFKQTPKQEDPGKQESKTVPMYRVYNRWSGEHLFTADKSEYDSLAKLGWQQEGTAWQAPSSGTPVYRLYNPYSGGHFYTADYSDYENLGSIGWRQEGVSFYSGGDYPVYRLFNPWLTQGTHLNTTDSVEYEDLGSIGWQKEGTAFYAAAL